MLHLLEEFLPEVEVRLWPSKIDNGVREMLLRRFPNLGIVVGDGALSTAFAECDFLLHGSGPSLVAWKDVVRWREETGKPYGVGGITLSSAPPEVVDVLSGAQFVFFRDSVSLEFARGSGITCSRMEFGPDGAFAVDVRDDARADAFLAAHGLEPGRFLCCIPRLRYTPYWRIHGKAMTDRDRERHARSEEMKEHDHAPLRAAITALVRDADTPVLICPEDRSQMAVGKEMLYDPLPGDVRDRVVCREDYWLTDEAVSTYARSAGVFGLEMHSPIMAIGNGIPAVVCRFAEQTSKGFMWRDIGLGDWLFDMDDDNDIAKIIPTVLSLAKDPDRSKAKVTAAQEFVRKHQEREMAAVLSGVGDSGSKPSDHAE